MLVTTTEQSEIPGDGPENAPIVLLVDCPAVSDHYTKRPLSGGTGSTYLGQFVANGIQRKQIRIESVCEKILPANNFYTLSEDARSYWRSDCFDRMKELSSTTKVFVPAGPEALRLLTGKSSLKKWHLSPLQTTPELGSVRALPLLDPHSIMRSFKDIVYISHGARRIAECLYHQRKPIERTFLLRPTYAQLAQWTEEALARAQWLTCDIETGCGQITCVGFSYAAQSAICVPTLPRDFSSAKDFHDTWLLIKRLLESDIKKSNQNILYDATYLSLYGIRIRNVAHDTMAAQKYLYPELEKGLDNCARMFAFETYWKDEGKDWTSRQNIDELYTYNCKDAAVTWEITQAQIQMLKEQGQLENFKSLVMDLWAPFTEMCWTGLPVKKAELMRLRAKTQSAVDACVAQINAIALLNLGKEINPRSNRQVKELIKACNFRLPTKDGKETSDYGALLKLRLKAPESAMLDALISFSKEQKKLASYLNYRFDEAASRMRFSLYINSTETGRAAGGKDPWERGINVQTIPRGELRGQFGYE